MKLLNGHFPIIREATENGIPSKDIRKSEAARVMMYMLGTVLRRFGFLMIAIPSKRFPKKEMALIRNRKNDSTISAAVDRFFSCWANISMEVNDAFMILANNDEF